MKKRTNGDLTRRSRELSKLFCCGHVKGVGEGVGKKTSSRSGRSRSGTLVWLNLKG